MGEGVDCQVIWTEPALADLARLLDERVDWSVSSAEQLGRQILHRIRLLEQFPELGPVYRPANSAMIRTLTCHPYRIFYEIQSGSPTIHIHHLRHGAREEPVAGQDFPTPLA